MTHIVHDFVRETTDTTGTGTTINLTGAVDESLPFSEVMANGDTCDYYIHEPGVGRESGVATYVSASNELTLEVRTSVAAGVESATRLNLQGAAKIGIGAPGEKTRFAKSLALWSTGDAKLTFKTTADDGWIVVDDGSIGSAASGASTRANADTEDLFKLLWDNCDNSICPVSGGRGASAQADFDADKTLTIPQQLGRQIIIAGNGSGLTARTLGDTGGQEDAIVVAHNHGPGTLAADSAGNHNHRQRFTSAAGGTGMDLANGGGSHSNTDEFTANAGTHTHSISGNTANAGESATDKNMPPWSAMNIMVKL